MKHLLASILLLFASNALADAGYSPVGMNSACPLRLFNYATNSCILSVGGGTSCGASPNQIQFGNGAGAFSCAPGLSFDGTNIVLPNGIKNAVSGGTIVLTDSGKIDLTPTSSVAGKCEITSGGAMTCDGTLTFGAAGVGRLKQSTASTF